VYGTGKTDRDLVFSAATLEALEQHLTPQEQQQYPLVMRPGMPLPNSSSSSSSSSSRAAHTYEATAPAKQPPQEASSSTQQEQQQGHVLTWRRYFHTQMAAVCSGLFRMKVPHVAAAGGAEGTVVEHDFQFVR
jgi:hypothetical protein